MLALADPRALSWQPWNLVGGGVLCLFGEFWRIWGCGHLRKNKAVITSGPYAHVRNPLYLGTLLILVGFLLAAGHRVVVYGLLPFGLIVFAVYYVPKKERVESERLRKRFGAEFEAYHAAVPGYLPRLTPWAQASEAGMSWSLVAENSEWETFALVVGGFCVLLARYFAVLPPYFGLKS